MCEIHPDITYILHNNTLLFYLYTLSKAYKRAATSTTQDHRKRFCYWWHSAEEGRECLETWDEERECDGWPRGPGNPGVDSCSFITIIQKCFTVKKSTQDVKRCTLEIELDGCHVWWLLFFLGTRVLYDVLTSLKSWFVILSKIMFILSEGCFVDLNCNVLAICCFSGTSGVVPKSS